MELLSGIKNFKSRRDALIIIREQLSLLMSKQASKELSGHAVKNCWEGNPSLFDGSRAPRPSNEGLATASLAHALKSGSCDDQTQEHVLFVLRELLKSSPQNKMDEVIFESTSQLVNTLTEKSSSELGPLDDEIEEILQGIDPNHVEKNNI